ncbi:MAG TPA: crosslink repair DNA glycosylase YcaQ family protein [Acidimicrobiales bacterium]|nr:crosslink repair DNA glycosylase YcaQ family protein [Acidimicrobiales bacterium]
MRRAGLSAKEARRLAVTAQGLHRPRPTGSATARQVGRAIDDVGVVQLDAINVLERTQYVVLFSRVGAYDTRLLDRLSGPGAPLFECSGPRAQLVPVAHEPLLRWRSALFASAYGDSPTHAPRWEAYHKANAAYIDAVLDEVRERGPLAASQLQDPRRRQGEWWGRRSDGRRALEFLFDRGELAAWRTSSFERVYDVPERVIPAEVLAQPTPTPDGAQRALLLLAARALGVATSGDLAHYYVLRPSVVKARVAELVEGGELQAVEVEGWTDTAYVVPGTKVGKKPVSTTAFLSPFDSLVWERRRTARVFGFDYRIEVYVPGPQRTYGYYVLPFLMGDQLVARFDLKADRKTGALAVRGAFAENGTNPPTVAAAAAEELLRLQEWLHLETVRVGPNGGLARELKTALRAN